MNREEWAEAKRGTISASNAWRLMGKDSTLENLAQDIVDQINGAPVIKSGIWQCDKGNEYEPMIRNQFYLDKLFDLGFTDLTMENHPIVFHPNYMYACCSPDNTYYYPNGMYFGHEVKCKFDTEKSGDKSWQKIQDKAERHHILQCLFGLWCCKHLSFKKWYITYAHITQDVMDGITTPETIEYEITPDDEIFDEFESRSQECWELVQEILHGC